MAIQYLGGKSAHAKSIATLVQAIGRGRPWWDPFCGGLSVATAIARTGLGVASDVNPALIALYQAVKDGWVPPNTVTPEEYAVARTLPDADPLKAFVGFGCSFGGRWFGGYVGPLPRSSGTALAHSLLRGRGLMRRITFRCESFLDVEPEPKRVVIYADPPYAGTTSYSGTPSFDHRRFWAVVQGWERCGVPVLVSEYTCPVPHTVVWRKGVRSTVARESNRRGRVEQIFRVIV